MLVSFVIFANQDAKHFFKSLASVLQQDSDDYELIVVEDSGFVQNSMILEGLAEKQKEISDKMHILVNVKGQGNAYGINTAIRYAKGDYVVFTNESQVFMKDFVSSIRDIVEKNKTKPDLIEFNLHHSVDNEHMGIRVNNKTDVLQNLADAPEIMAHVNPAIANKLFKLSVLRESGVHIRNFVWYQTLFLYKFMAHIKTYYGSSLDGGMIYPIEIKFSIFDLIKQWVHIFNYYREADLYKTYQNELDYAYSHYLLIDFPNLVIYGCSHHLVIKALTSAQNKLSRRSRYLDSNPYVLSHADKSFVKITNNINGHFKKLKEIKE